MKELTIAALASLWWAEGMGELRFGLGIVGLVMVAPTLAGCQDAAQISSSAGRSQGSVGAPGAEALAAQSLRRSYIQKTQSGAVFDDRYAVSRTSGPRLEAHHFAQGLALHFSEAGAALSATSEGWQLGLSAAAIRCGGELTSLDRVPARPTDEANHVRFERPVNGAHLDEWYINGPLGLEQGFTLTESPCPPGASELSIEVAVTGLTPHLAPAERDGASPQLVHFEDESGRIRAHYSDWFAYDANHQNLPMDVLVDSSRLTLRITLATDAWPIVVDPLVWGGRRILTPSDNPIDPAFGYSVALSGNMAIVGAISDNAQRGAAYVYVRSGPDWTEEAKLTASDAEASDRFGFAVALSGSTALIGSARADSEQGAAYVFVRSGTTWTEQAKLVASDGAEFDWFGQSVALTGNTALVGSLADDSQRGSAYVFVRSGTTWTEQARLTASDRALGDVFGYSVALSAETALVGARDDDSYRGSAYVYVRSGTTWSEQTKLTASDRALNDRFGNSVALSGDTALIGALDDDASEGSAHVYVRSGTTWTAQQKLTASNGSASLEFGNAVTLSGDRALVGTHNSVYAFSRTGTTWTEQQELTETGAESVALSADTGILGSVGNARAYAFRFGLSDSDPCSTDSECASDYCVEGVCCDAPCLGTCTSCLASRKTSGVDGVCGSVAVNTDPRNHCDSTAVSSCGLNGSCNGVGACALYAAGTECVSTSCVTQESQNPADTCDGGGNCLPTAQHACAPGYLCLSGACRTSCTGDGDCDVGDGYACVGAECKKRVNGATCTQSKACESNFCVEGVCCDSGCESSCKSCLAAYKASGSDGLCGNVASGTDPFLQCAEATATTCGSNGFCDGAGSCALYGSSTECAPASCPTPTSEDPADSCSGLGTCSVTLAQECQAGYLCLAGACKTSCSNDADCLVAGGYACLAGQCKLPTGTPCAAGDLCETGYCQDGVCCQVACEGQCEACAEPGQAGQCVAAVGAPRGARKACDDSGDVDCAERCDGEERLECRFVPATTACGQSTCVDGVESANECDGQGRCHAEAPRRCSPYACGADECFTTCAQDDDCALGFACSKGDCVRRTARCSDELDATVDSEGLATPCAPFRCDPGTGACLQICRASTDCSSAFSCNDASNECEAATQTSTDEGGCSCRAAGAKRSSGAPPSWLALSVLGLALAARRRAFLRRST